MNQRRRDPGPKTPHRGIISPVSIAAFARPAARVTDRLWDIGDIVKLIEDWLRLHGAHGFVFDGFPRTLPQAESLHAILGRHGTPLDLAIWLEASEDTVRERIAGRLQCRSCGFVTSTAAGNFAERAVCPYCEGPLVRRNDDDLQILQNRLKEYRAKTEPLAAFYKQSGVLRRIDGNRDRESVFADVARLIESK